MTDICKDTCRVDKYLDGVYRCKLCRRLFYPADQIPDATFSEFFGNWTEADEQTEAEPLDINLLICDKPSVSVK